MSDYGNYIQKKNIDLKTLLARSFFVYGSFLAKQK